MSYTIWLPIPQAINLLNLDEGDNNVHFCDRELTVHVMISKTQRGQYNV